MTLFTDNPFEKMMIQRPCGRRDNTPPVFKCAPGGARFLRVEVPNPPGSGKDIAEGKGVEGDLESEGSRM